MKKYLTIAALLVSAASLRAQTDSTLAHAVRVAAEGQTDSAQALVRSVLNNLGSSDELMSEALFFAGVVEADLARARSFFRRVSIEFSNSEWADRALLRLSQLAFAAGNYQQALDQSRRVITDYPFTNLKADASYWAGRALMMTGRMTDGCDLLAEAAEAATDDIELRNRAEFYLQRCAAIADEAPDSSAVAEAQETQEGSYTVQVAALSSASTVDQLMRDLRQAGFDPRVVRDDSGLFKVRVGRFASRDDAADLARRLRATVDGEPFVVEEN